jgi:hypothetical protein
VLSGGAANTNVLVIGLTCDLWVVKEVEPPAYHTRDKITNHYGTDNILVYIFKVKIK